MSTIILNNNINNINNNNQTKAWCLFDKRFLKKSFHYPPSSQKTFVRNPALSQVIVKPESEVPKERPKGLGLTLKSHGPPNPNF